MWMLHGFKSYSSEQFRMVLLFQNKKMHARGHLPAAPPTTETPRLSGPAPRDTWANPQTFRVIVSLLVREFRFIALYAPRSGNELASRHISRVVLPFSCRHFAQPMFSFGADCLLRHCILGLNKSFAIEFLCHTFVLILGLYWIVLVATHQGNAEAAASVDSVMLKPPA